MRAPPFDLKFTPEAKTVLEEIASDASHRAKAKKIAKTLRQLQQASPKCTGLHSHQYTSVDGPAGLPLWESYVENRTPGAWRIFWAYGPESDTLTIITVGPHP